jgi:3-hydroxyanthranilate 3,4-dioxygenase
MLLPFNFQQWISQNKDKLKPPVSNFCLWQEQDFIVMALGGPNSRTDYHVNPTEEFFYQLKGDMILKIHNGSFQEIPIKEGEMFLLPANIPHNPCRFEDTVGLVIERTRPEGSLGVCC